MSYNVLAINPGSTSTKVAVYSDGRPLLELALRHTLEEVSKFHCAIDQSDWRRDLILSALKEHDFDIKTLSAVIGRGGLVHPVPGGVYEVNQKMCDDLINAKKKHVCNIGAMLAREIADEIGVKAYIADPPVVDELCDEARITGLPECTHRSVFHALNHRATARVHCEKMGVRYEDSDLIVAHMGGGISVAAHAHGKIIDVNNALDGDGTFAPDRAGSIPSSELIRVCFSGKYTEAELIKRISSKGGLVAYLGTNSVMEIQERIDQGDEYAAKLLNAMSYNISKQIASLSAVFKGKVDAIILTGGIAYNTPIVDYIKDHCSFIAPIHVYPGENELRSLASNALRVLSGEAEAQVYE